MVDPVINETYMDNIAEFTGAIQLLAKNSRFFAENQ